MTPKAKATKPKVDKWGHIKGLSFCTAESEGITSRKDKTSVNYKTAKRLISKIYKHPTQFNRKKTEIAQIKNGQRTLMANRYRKTCQTSLIIRKMQIKTTMRYGNITLIRFTII
jgi:hypothetical protein